MWDIYIYIYIYIYCLASIKQNDLGDVADALCRILLNISLIHYLKSKHSDSSLLLSLLYLSILSKPQRFRRSSRLSCLRKHHRRLFLAILAKIWCLVQRVQLCSLSLTHRLRSGCDCFHSWLRGAITLPCTLSLCLKHRTVRRCGKSSW